MASTMRYYNSGSSEGNLFLKKIPQPQFNSAAVLFFAKVASRIACQEGTAQSNFPVGVSGIDDFRSEIKNIKRLLHAGPGVEVVSTGIRARIIAGAGYSRRSMVFSGVETLDSAASTRS